MLRDTGFVRSPLLDAIREAMEHEGLDRSIQKSGLGLRLIGEPAKQNLLALCRFYVFLSFRRRRGCLRSVQSGGDLPLLNQLL